MPLYREFYERDTAKVARELLGKVLLRRGSETNMSGKIVETEAYYGVDDPASRASSKRTKINEIMWRRGGLVLVYMVHGNWLFNVITESEGTPGGVLIRALEPLEGISQMEDRRRKEDFLELTSGPGKLTEALGITNDLHGADLAGSGEILISEEFDEEFEIKSSHRIGVSEDLDRELRYYIAGNDHVSRR